MTTPATARSAASAGPIAWDAAHINESDWRIPVPAEVAAEILSMARSAQPEPAAEDRSTEAVPAKLARLLQEVRQRVLHGHGVVVLCGLPVQSLNAAERSRLVRRVAHAFGPVVIQDIKSTRFYDVVDTGQTVQYGVRRSKTNVDQELHTDGGWFDPPPQVICLYCLEQAKSGGKSQIASLLHVVEELRESQPEIIRTLEQRMPWDRQAEHPPHEQKWADQPVLWTESSESRLRWYRDYVRNGHRLAGREVDPALQRALDRFFEILAREENHIELQLQPGDVAFVNNYACAHARSEFEPGSARHMVRVWHRFDD